MVSAGIFMIFLVYSFMDFSNPSSDHVNAESSEVPAKTHAQLKLIETPKITFLYCYSWGYRAAFEQYADVLSKRFPGLEIVGDNYPPPSPRRELSFLLSAAKIILIGCIMMGYNPFPTLFNAPTPNIYSWLLNNKMYGSFVVFFVSGMVESQLVSTGAFEVLLNEEIIWSKLSIGRVPSPPELMQIITSALDKHRQMLQDVTSETL